MENYVAYLSAGSTLLGIVFFVGIVYWACSKNRQAANEASASLPFELPDEFKKD